MSWFDMRVRSLREEARDILGLELVPLNGEPLPFSWSPGAHVDVRLPDGLVRQYSLVSQPADGHLYLAIKRDGSSRGGSRWLHEHLRLGQTLSVGEPRNLFSLEDGEGEVLLIAAGIGITPLLAMHRACRARGRQVHLHYFAREWPGFAFLKELSGQNQVYLHAGLERAAVHDQLGALLASRHAEANLYCCGPSGFMQRVREQALEAGWPETRYIRNTFNPLSSQSWQGRARTRRQRARRASGGG